MIIIEYDTKNKFIKVTSNILKNGGAGSGNWGHGGRPGKIGGSSKDGGGIPSQHEKERRSYGRRLRELSEIFGADNIGKKYKEKSTKIKQQLQQQKQLKKESKLNKEEALKNKGTKILVKSDGGGLLIEKDGKVAWINARFIREDGTLTAGGEKALKDGKTSEEYYKEDAIIKQRIVEKNAFKEKIKKETGVDLNDDAHLNTGEAIYKAIKANPEMQNIISKIDDNFIYNLAPQTASNFAYINSQKGYGNIVFFDANYWESKDRSKKRIYFNLQNPMSIKDYTTYIDIDEIKNKL